MKPEVYKILRNKFPAGEFALLDEVRDAAGFQASRSADAIAYGLWPSRGHEVHGIEIKSFRGDWLKEYKNPQKAESIFKYCDRFWLLATDESVVLNESEIPKNWGYLLIKGDRLKTKKDAPPLKSKQLDKSFIGAMLKRATGRMIHPAEIDEKIKKAKVEAEYQIQTEFTKLKNQHDNLLKDIKAFEDASGLKIHSEDWWSEDNAAHIGAAVKIVVHNTKKLNGHVHDLIEVRDKMLKSVDVIKELLDAHPEIMAAYLNSKNKKSKYI
jgi:hypothetical protein